MLDGFKTGGVSDLLEWHRRLSDERSCARELYAPNRAVKCVPQGLFDSQLETRSGHCYRIDYVRYLDTFHGVLLYKTQGFRYHRVFNSQDVARLASYDPFRVHNEAAPGRLFPEHHPVQQRGRFVPDDSRALFNAAQRRTHELTQHLVIVDSDYRHFVRNLQLICAAHLNHVPATIIICSHDTDGFRERQ